MMNRNNMVSLLYHICFLILPKKKKKVDNQCYVISSTINRRNEFKTDQYPIVKNFRILLKKSLSKD